MKPRDYLLVVRIALEEYMKDDAQIGSTFLKII